MVLLSLCVCVWMPIVQKEKTPILTFSVSVSFKERFSKKNILKNHPLGSEDSSCSFALGFLLKRRQSTAVTLL